MSKLFNRARFLWDHRWTPRRMSAYVDGELVPRERMRLERHVRECADCGRLLARLRQTLGALHVLPAPGNPDPYRFAATVRVRLREPPRSD